MTDTAPHPSRTALTAWKTPIWIADFEGTEEINITLRELILEAEKVDPDAALFGGIDAVKSSQDILHWQHPAIDWFKGRILQAVTALTADILGEAAKEVTQGIKAEAWAVVYRSGGSLRPHTHHDSAWSGVYYVSAPSSDDGRESGYLQILDPRPAAVARQVSQGVVRVQPVPGRMVAFPGWLPHSVSATATGSDMRICVAWNVAYDNAWGGMR
ncbi:TIGR02466 family protein [Nonomuraea dietziae]|uniref:Uncharacterized protein (TIGR02466 family) n=1 Tax=Nonomuraea dietziae TaxID=65515 RepID=A0A7W5YTA9_9ACTN|nr:TIGR02466 family protein [Nonomuraea dietziae]MBB3733792.1 uncharacterized protein (TIGR02466 family) [Nonomuraea dietziae]